MAKPPVILSPLSSTSRVLKIGMSSKTLSQMDMTTRRQVDHPAAAHGHPRRRQRRHLGRARPADPGPRRPAAPPGPRRHLRRGRQGRRRGRQDRRRRLRRHAQPAVGRRLHLGHQSPRDLAKVPVAVRNGVPLKLGDLAELVEGFPPPIGDAIINDGPGLLLIVEKQPWGNTLEVTRTDRGGPGRPAAGADGHRRSTRPSSGRRRSSRCRLHNLNRALLIGCVLVILVLVFFLNDWRSALITSLAIPTSLIAAGLVLHYRGGTINTMVLAGLIIALGELVDDAIIDVENIVRRLRLNRASPKPESVFEVVLKASLEVRSAVVHGSIIVVLVLLPIFLLRRAVRVRSSGRWPCPTSWPSCRRCSSP